MPNNKLTPTENQEKRQETVAKRQQENKEKIIEHLKKQPVIQVAVARAGVSRSTFYRWLEHDPAFEQAAIAAMRHGVSYINDAVESQLIKKAISGESLGAMIFWLKNHHVVYTEKQLHRHIHEIIGSAESSDEIDEREKKRLIDEQFRDFIKRDSPWPDNEAPELPTSSQQ